MTVSVGFIGYGEAAYHMTKGLYRAGLVDLCAYDLLVGSSDADESMRSRAEEVGVALLDSMAAVIDRSDVVISAVTPGASVEVAHEAASLLSARHFFVDINSVSPTIMKRVAEEALASGAGFVEAAVMGAVPIYKHRVPMLLAGERAEEFARLMSPWGLQMEVVGTQVGQACVVKMFRSVLIKGVEALILECLLGASKYGVEERVLHSASESMAGFNWSEWSDYLTRRTAMHAERRGNEMDEVAQTLTAIGVDPIMSRAAAQRFHWASDVGLTAKFKEKPPQNYKEVISATWVLISPDDQPGT